MNLGRPGRNDSCPCGSGKKYKNCCLGRDRAQHIRDSSWRSEEQVTVDKLLAFAQRPELSAQSTVAFNLFWNGNYGLAALRLLERGEISRFLDWYVFDYRLEGTGKRIVDLFAKEAEARLQQAERERVHAWQQSHTSLYRIASLDQGSSLDLIDVLQERQIMVWDTGFGRLGLTGDLVLGRVLHSSDPPHLSWAAVLLPADMEAGILAFARLGYVQYRETHPEALWQEFLSPSGYIFNHYLLKMAAEAGKARPSTRNHYDAHATVEKLHEAERQLHEQTAKRAWEVRQAQKSAADSKTAPLRQTQGGVLIPGSARYKASKDEEG